LCPRSSIGRQVLGVGLPLLDLTRSAIYNITFIFINTPLQHTKVTIIIIIIIIIILKK